MHHNCLEGLLKHTHEPWPGGWVGWSITPCSKRLWVPSQGSIWRGYPPIFLSLSLFLFLPTYSRSLSLALTRAHALPLLSLELSVSLSCISSGEKLKNKTKKKPLARVCHSFGFDRCGWIFAFLNRAQVMLMTGDNIENHCTTLALKL